MKNVRPSPHLNVFRSLSRESARAGTSFWRIFPGLATFLFCVLPHPRAAAQNETTSSAAAYAVIDHHTGHVLDSYNGKKKLPVASLTKVVTAVVTLDWAQATKRDLEQPVLISGESLELQNGHGVPWKIHDQISLRDLLYAALLQSDNIAAQNVAEHVGRQLNPSEDRSGPGVAFIAQMNALARKMNLSNTRFLNPHGLEGLERKLPYSCAEDMAQLTAYAMSHPAFRFIVSQKERRITIQHADGSKTTYHLRNTNELLGVDAIDGVKTGTTRQAGQCVAISAGRPPEVRQVGDEFFRTPRRLEVVVLGSENRFPEARSLMENGWHRHQRWVEAGRPMETKTAKGGLREKLGL